MANILFIFCEEAPALYQLELLSFTWPTLLSFIHTRYQIKTRQTHYKYLFLVDLEGVEPSSLILSWYYQQVVLCGFGELRYPDPLITYHYSFHYQITVRFSLIKFRMLTKLVICLWSGLYLNHIETRPYSSLIEQPAVRYRNHLRSCYYYTLNLGSSCIASTHCL